MKESSVKIMRNFEIENNDINVNLVYMLDAEEKLDMVALEMIQHNKIKGLLDMVYTQNNTDKLLKYNITSKITLEQILERNITKDTIIKSFINIINTIILAEDYMLEQNAFIMETDKIYVNIGTYDIGLIYLPVINDNKEVSMEKFFKNIIFTSKFDQSENCEYVAKIISYLNAPVFSLNDFKTFLYELIGQSQTEKNDTQKEIHNFEIQKNIEKEVKTTVDAFVDNVSSSLNIPENTIKKINSQAQDTVNIPSASGMAVSQQKNVKSTKKGGLFGGFGKKNKEQNIIMKKNDNKTENKKYAIPNNNLSNISVTESSIPDRSVPVNSNVNVQANAIKTNAIKTNISMSFGETTVLNQGNMGETTILSSNMQNDRCISDTKKAYLIRKRNGERIFIDRDVFRIGKEKSYVDYFIADNAAISRSHAEILKRDCRFYVKDTNSKNHTYVNGRVIQSDTEVILETGYTLCLADEEFIFQTD